MLGSSDLIRRRRRGGQTGLRIDFAPDSEWCDRGVRIVSEGRPTKAGTSSSPKGALRTWRTTPTVVDGLGRLRWVSVPSRPGGHRRRKEWPAPRRSTCIGNVDSTIGDGSCALTQFWRDGHWRTGPSGQAHWVDGHFVHRDDWDHSSPNLTARTLWLSGLAWSRTYLDEETPNAKCPGCGQAGLVLQESERRLRVL